MNQHPHFTPEQVIAETTRVHGRVVDESKNYQVKFHITSVKLCNDDVNLGKVAWRVEWTNTLMSSDGEREINATDLDTTYIEVNDPSVGFYLWPIVFHKVENWSEL